jgi:hypothetical protein
VRPEDGIDRVGADGLALWYLIEVSAMGVCSGEDEADGDEKECYRSHVVRRGWHLWRRGLGPLRDAIVQGSAKLLEDRIVMLAVRQLSSPYLTAYGCSKPIYWKSIYRG